VSTLTLYIPLDAPILNPDILFEICTIHFINGDDPISFYLKLILSILNGRSRFEVDASNGVYEVNIGTSFKILINVKLSIKLLTGIIHFI
jgi:hypothetical protein